MRNDEFDFSRDSDRTCFQHLDKHIPQSIREEAKEELMHRGYGRDTIEEYEYNRSRCY